MEILLGKTSGFCFGVQNAISGAEKILDNSSDNVYCLGEIIHNEEVINYLKEKGLIFIDDINEAEKEVIIRAHGVPKEIYEKAKEKNIKIIDYTCPFVLKIHDEVIKYSNKNYFIFLLGIKNHPETIGTISFCGENSCIIENIDDIENAIAKFNKSNLSNLLVISQTTFSTSLFNTIATILKERLSSDIKIEIKNTICNTTANRQKETEEISKKVDLMIIIGGKNSSNTKKLYEIAKINCPKVMLIQTKDSLKQYDFQGVKKIGIMAGASTPQSIIEDVVAFCKK